MAIIKINNEKTSKTIKAIKKCFIKDGKIIRIHLKEITTIPELEKAFHMDSSVKGRIKDDMSKNGFSKAKPIHIFWWEEHWVLCDGHTRYTSAKELGIQVIWAQIHEFKSINEALLFSMKEQFNRRNIEDSELFKQFELLQQQENNGHKITTEEKSNMLKISRRTFFKIDEVSRKSTPQQLQNIRNGKTSINKIYNEIKQQENSEIEKQKADKQLLAKQKQEEEAANLFKEPTDEEIEQSVHKQAEATFQKKQRELHNKELELKQKELSLSTSLSNKQILLLGAKYALFQKAKGKNDEEILQTNCFEATEDCPFTAEEIALLKAI